MILVLVFPQVESLPSLAVCNLWKQMQLGKNSLFSLLSSYFSSPSSCSCSSSFLSSSSLLLHFYFFFLFIRECVLFSVHIPSSLFFSFSLLHFLLTHSFPFSYITIWPAHASQPFASASNQQIGLQVYSSVYAVASQQGNFKIFSSGASSLILDVTGYFSAASGYSFYS